MHTPEPANPAELADIEPSKFPVDLTHLPVIPLAEPPRGGPDFPWALR